MNVKLQDDAVTYIIECSGFDSDYLLSSYISMVFFTRVPGFRNGISRKLGELTQWDR